MNDGPDGERAAQVRPGNPWGAPEPAGPALPREEKLRLELLGAIADNHQATQRDLAARLGIALGLTNALIKRLARKGYIKVRHVSPRRVTYLLTPKGILEKSRLTYSYIQFSVGYYRELRSRLQALFDHLAAQGARRLAFYGAGEVAEIASICLHGTPLEVVAVVDERRAGAIFLGHLVGRSTELRHVAADAVIVTAPIEPAQLVESLGQLGIPANKIWGLGERRPVAGSVVEARRAGRDADGRAVVRGDL